MSVSRRRFLMGAAGAALGLPVLSRRSSAVSANDRIVVAHVGVGGMGRQHVGWFASLEDVETAAVCDVNLANAHTALEHLKAARPDTKAVVEQDFRRLLDRSDIDVITCATPDHWHALVAILAFQSGKHVYGEKPLSYDIAESQAMLKACRRYQRVFQLGTQIHSGENYHRVVELLRAGVIGDVKHVLMWKTGDGLGNQFVPDGQAPPDFNWDLWLGPAPYRPYNRVIAERGFRFYWDYSSGTFGDFWCHLGDLPYWALKLGAPQSVSATGSDPIDTIATTPIHMDVKFRYPNLTMEWRSRNPNLPGFGDSHVGIQFVGTTGELVCNYERRKIRIDGNEYDDIPEVPITLPRSPGHQRHFLDCIRSGGTPESNITHAATMALPAHLACISYRLGREVRWDAVGGKFIGDDAANRMRHRPYRAPWMLPTG